MGPSPQRWSSPVGYGSKSLENRVLTRILYVNILFAHIATRSSAKWRATIWGSYIPDSPRVSAPLRSALIVNRALGYEALPKFTSVLNMLLIGTYACCCIADQMELECGPMPNVMVALPNIGGAFCSTP